MSEPTLTGYKKYPQETILINRDPDRFVYSTDSFKTIKNYGSLRGERLAVNYLLDEAKKGNVKLTDKFTELVMNKVPARYEEAVNMSLITSDDSFSYVPPSKIEKNFRKQLDTAHNILVEETKGDIVVTRQPTRKETEMAERMRIAQLQLEAREKRSNMPPMPVPAPAPVPRMPPPPIPAPSMSAEEGKYMSNISSGTTRTETLTKVEEPSVVPKKDSFSTLAAQIANVDKNLENALNNLAIQEVSKNVESYDKYKEDIRTGNVAMINDKKFIVNEPTIVVGTNYKEETPNVVMSELIESAPISAPPMSPMTTNVKRVVESWLSDSSSSVDANSRRVVESWLSDSSDSNDENARRVVESWLQSSSSDNIGDPDSNTRRVIESWLNEEPEQNQDPEQEIQVQEQTQTGEPERVVDESFAVDDVPQEHMPKYHKMAIMFFLGNPPIYDKELEKNIYSSGISEAERVMCMDVLIATYGAALCIEKRMSTTLDEFHELMQLKFCLFRNLQRGTRSASAMVPLSSLTSFANKLQGPSNAPMPPVPVKVPDMPDVGMGGMGGGMGGAGAGLGPSQPQIAGPLPKVAAIGGKQGVQVKIAQNEALQAVVDAYNNSQYDLRGKPILKPELIEQTKEVSFNIIGPNSAIDPANQYNKYIHINVKKVKPKKNIIKPYSNIPPV